MTCRHTSAQHTKVYDLYMPFINYAQDADKAAISAFKGSKHQVKSPHPLSIGCTMLKAKTTQ